MAQIGLRPRCRTNAHIPAGYPGAGWLACHGEVRGGRGAGIDVNEDTEDRDHPPEADKHVQRRPRGLLEGVTNHL